MYCIYRVDTWLCWWTYWSCTICDCAGTVWVYRPGSLTDGAVEVICTSSCAWRECYSKAWLWNALLKHYSPTHTLYYVPFTCWLKTSGWHLSGIKWYPSFISSQMCFLHRSIQWMKTSQMPGSVYLPLSQKTFMDIHIHARWYSCQRHRSAQSGAPSQPPASDRCHIREACGCDRCLSGTEDFWSFLNSLLKTYLFLIPCKPGAVSSVMKTGWVRAYRNRCCVRRC